MSVHLLIFLVAFHFISVSFYLSQNVSSGTGDSIVPWYQYELNWNLGCGFFCPVILHNIVQYETSPFCNSILLMLPYVFEVCAVLTGSPLCSQHSHLFTWLNFILQILEWLSTFSIHFIFNPVFQGACNLVQLAFYTFFFW